MSNITYNPTIVPLGGTGNATLTARGVLLGQGTSPVTTVVGSSAGQVLTWVSSLIDSTFQTPAAQTGWKLIEARAVVGNEVFTGLSGYTVILVILINVTSSLAGFRWVRVSTDNGVTYLNASGDYINVSAGTISNETSMVLSGASSTAAQTVFARIDPFSLSGTSKTANNNANRYIIPTTTALNALEVINSVGTPNGGTIYLLGII